MYHQITYLLDYAYFYKFTRMRTNPLSYILVLSLKEKNKQTESF